MHMLYWFCMEILIDLCLVLIDWTVTIHVVCQMRSRMSARVPLEHRRGVTNGLGQPVGELHVLPGSVGWLRACRLKRLRIKPSLRAVGVHCLQGWLLVRQHHQMSVTH